MRASCDVPAAEADEWTAPRDALPATGDSEMFANSQIVTGTRALALAALLGLAGCQAEPDGQSAAESAEMPAGHPDTGGEAAPAAGQMEAPHGQVSVLIYQCADDRGFALTVAAGVGKAALRFDEGTFQLDQQEVASGMEYSDGTYTFRGQGMEGYVEKDGERILTDCQATGHPQSPEAETPEI